MQSKRFLLGVFVALFVTVFVVMAREIVASSPAVNCQSLYETMQAHIVARSEIKNELNERRYELKYKEDKSRRILAPLERKIWHEQQRMERIRKSYASTFTHLEKKIAEKTKDIDRYKKIYAEKCSKSNRTD